MIPGSTTGAKLAQDSALFLKPLKRSANPAGVPHAGFRCDCFFAREARTTVEIGVPREDQQYSDLAGRELWLDVKPTQIKKGVPVVVADMGGIGPRSRNRLWAAASILHSAWF